MLITQSALIELPSRRNRDILVSVACLGTAVAIALAFGRLIPSLGAPAFALLAGLAIRSISGDVVQTRFLSRVSRLALQTAIVCLGATFGLREVFDVGRSSLPVMLATVALALGIACMLTTALQIPPRLGTLVGVGTAICGASAIGAVSPLIEATDAEIAYAMATIFVFNVTAIVLYPPLGHLLSMSQHAFGLWAGTAVNDTSSVVAAASAYGHGAASVAVVTKLARTTLIIPIAVAVALRWSGGPRPSILRLVPGFLVAFLAASALRSTGLIGDEAKSVASQAASTLIVVALGAAGLATTPALLRRAGPRPLLLGAALWATVGVSGLALQYVL